MLSAGLRLQLGYYTARLIMHFVRTEQICQPQILAELAPADMVLLATSQCNSHAHVNMMSLD